MKDIENEILKQIQKKGLDEALRKKLEKDIIELKNRIKKIDDLISKRKSFYSNGHQ